MNNLLPKPFLYKNLNGIILPMTVDKRVHAFSKGICPKVNVIAQQEFNLWSSYYDVAVKHVNHYTTVTALIWFQVFLSNKTVQCHTQNNLMGGIFTSL